MSKTALITGASSGIGLVTAKHFAAQGWNVIATMRDPMFSELKELPNVLVMPLDVTNEPSIKTAVTEGIKKFGSIDALVNNAGYGQFGLFEAASKEKIQEQFDVNVFGVMNVTRAVLPHMRKIKHGVILNISSGAGIFTLPMISLYCASKFALEGFSEALAYELASQNILVKIIQPHGGVNNTNFQDKSAHMNAQVSSLSDYDQFVIKTGEAFAKMTAARVLDSSDVAKVIFTAATDGSKQLRYLVGNDTRGFIKARQELSDQDYIDFMRKRFG